MSTFDVIVCGSGPAGAAVALNLSLVARVLLIDRIDPNSNADKPGECLAPAARRLFTDMGLLKAFQGDDHLRCFARRATWGYPTVEELDLIRDIDGPGWLLDRPCFDAWLRGVAVQRGTVMMPCTTLHSIEFDSDKQFWKATLASSNGRRELVQARVLVDASGRHANIARTVGARRTTEENPLICLWISGTSSHESPQTMGSTTVEATDFGWWYTAPLPGDRRVLALHTAPGVLAEQPRDAKELLALSKSASTIFDIVGATGFSPDRPVRQIVAHGGILQPAAGRAWFAAGDAAVHFDPISSQGLLNALFTGLAVADCASRVLSGLPMGAAAEEYNRLINRIYDAYQTHLTTTYQQEQRWTHAHFWASRHTRKTPQM